ncbi:hypothetical protein [Hoeflea sp.]|uniref:hypothetical protein n=1 Tax=Hoeflea sp. TaxID=1940281 RepID=UPI0025B94752|nr:hypothetical protein [Hoeflea sp.]
MPLPPAFAGVSLQIRKAVQFIDDFFAEQGLDEIFKRDDACGSSIGIHHKGDMTILVDEGVEQFVTRGRLDDCAEVELEFQQLLPSVVLDGFEQQIGLEPEPCDGVDRAVKDRDA